MDRKAKLRALAEEWGCSSPEELLEQYSTGGTVPGICTNPSCSFAAEYESDQREGFCEECETQTVSSAFVLAELI